MQNKNQHTIPHGYLRKFVDPESPSNKKPYCWVYNRKTKRSFRRSPKKLETRPYYYSNRDAKGELDDAPDRILQDIENRGLPILDKLDKGRCLPHLNETDRKAASELLATFYLRVPTFRNTVEDLVGEIGKTVLKTLAASYKRFDNFICRSIKQAGKETPGNIEKLRRAYLLGDFSIEANPALSLELMFILIPMIADYIYDFHWRILEAPLNHRFITSDRPLVLITTERPRVRMDGVGWETPWMEATLPLSPRNLLLISQHYPEGHERVSQDKVAEANRRTYAYGERIYSSAGINPIYLERPVGWIWWQPLTSVIVESVSQVEMSSKEDS